MPLAKLLRLTSEVDGLSLRVQAATQGSKTYKPHSTALPLMRQIADDMGLTLKAQGKEVTFSGDKRMLAELEEVYEDMLNGQPVKPESRSKNPYHDVGGN